MDLGTMDFSAIFTGPGLVLLGQIIYIVSLVTSALAGHNHDQTTFGLFLPDALAQLPSSTRPEATP